VANVMVASSNTSLLPCFRLCVSILAIVSAVPIPYAVGQHSELALLRVGQLNLIAGSIRLDPGTTKNDDNPHDDGKGMRSRRDLSGIRTTTKRPEMYGSPRR
jgi:hypothetical protein